MLVLEAPSSSLNMEGGVPVSPFSCCKGAVFFRGLKGTLP